MECSTVDNSVVAKKTYSSCPQMYQRKVTLEERRLMFVLDTQTHTQSTCITYHTHTFPSFLPKGMLLYMYFYNVLFSRNSR